MLVTQDIDEYYRDSGDVIQYGHNDHNDDQDLNENDANDVSYVNNEYMNETGEN